jgi:hypothetical protein
MTRSVPANQFSFCASTPKLFMDCSSLRISLGARQYFSLTQQFPPVSPESASLWTWAHPYVTPSNTFDGAQCLIIGRRDDIWRRSRRITKVNANRWQRWVMRPYYLVRSTADEHYFGKASVDTTRAKGQSSKEERSQSSEFKLVLRRLYNVRNDPPPTRKV